MHNFFDPPMKIHRTQSGPCDPQPYRECSPFLFYKIDAQTGFALAGAVFTLACGSVKLSSQISDANGTVCFPPLEPGCYTLVETTPPVGYSKSPQAYTVTVDDCGYIYVDGMPATRFRVPNYKSENHSFTAIKYDQSTGMPLSGAEFSLLSAGSVLYRSVSDVSGRISFQNLEPGTYTLMETKLPAGYTSASGPYSVVVTNHGTVTIDGQPGDSFPLYNQPGQKEVSFTKLDANTKYPLAGATFSLHSGTTTVSTATSDETGLVSFGMLPSSTYMLQEQTPPDGYLPDSTTYPVVVHADGSVTIDNLPAGTFTIGNFSIPSLSALKQDENALPLAGAQFQLSQNGTPVHTVTTTEDGLASFPSLKPGTYLLVETLPPDGYLLDPTEHQIVVLPDGKITVDRVPTSRLTVANQRNAQPCSLE